MPYTKDIPNATDRPSDSQALMKSNYQAIYTVNGINHVQFDDPSGDQGKHKWISFPLQAVSPTTAATETALFSRTSALSGGVELAIRKQSDGTVTEFTSAGKTGDGWAILPSGILIKWGSTGAIGSGEKTVFWPTGVTIPVFSQVFNIQLTPQNNSTSDVDIATRLIDFGTTQLRIYNSKRTDTGAATTTFATYIFAIGLP